MTMTKLEIIQDVKANGYRKLTYTHDGKQHKVMLDGYTASMLLQVHNALNDDNKVKLLDMPWHKMVSVGWKLVTKQAA